MLHNVSQRSRGTIWNRMLSRSFPRLFIWKNLLIILDYHQKIGFSGHRFSALSLAIIFLESNLMIAIPKNTHENSPPCQSFNKHKCFLRSISMGARIDFNAVDPLFSRAASSNVFLFVIVDARKSFFPLHSEFEPSYVLRPMALRLGMLAEPIARTQKQHTARTHFHSLRQSCRMRSKLVGKNAAAKEERKSVRYEK